MDEGEEVTGSAIEAGGEAPKVFELVQASFNAIAGFIEGLVVWDRGRARSCRWDDGDHAGIADDLSEVVAVKGLVGDDAAALEVLSH